MEHSSWLGIIIRPMIWLVLAGFLGATACSDPAPAETVDLLADVEQGTLRGELNGDSSVISFKGVPFAKPPIGALRWKAPMPAESWDGVREANKFGPSAIQNLRYTHLPNGPWTEEFMVQNEVSEDCLYLNVWAPAQDPTDKLPVMVYIHGGALTEGSGAIDVYDGEELAKKGIIVVTINYRLGVLGFMAHPELTAESPNGTSGNYGFLDQIAALQWIQKNIHAFGGDPDKVTIAGQSAGAGSVRILTASPLASGLFHGAITQSGSSLITGRPTMTLEEAEKQGVEFSKLKGAASLQELRALTPDELLEPTEPSMRFRGNIDGYLQTADISTIFAEGKENDTPFMTGLNADETRYRGSEDASFQKYYPFTSDEEKAAAVKSAGQQQSMLNAWLWLAHRASTAKTDGYIYYFDRAIPWPQYPEFGAFHTGEVPYVFNNLKKLDRPWTAVDTMVAETMSSYWVNFVKTGDPNGTDLPTWKPYQADKKEVMHIGEDMGMKPVTATDEMFEFLEGQLRESI